MLCNAGSNKKFTANFIKINCYSLIKDVYKNDALISVSKLILSTKLLYKWLVVRWVAICVCLCNLLSHFSLCIHMWLSTVCMVPAKAWT